MKNYVVTGQKATFGAGYRLKLTPEQAGRRKHSLRFIGGGVFETVGAVEFKAGEKIGVVGEVSKAHLAVIADEKEVEKAKKEAEANAAAAAESAKKAGPVKASAALIRLAAEKGVDLAAVAGTGKGGAITRADILAAAEAKEAGGEDGHDEDDSGESDSGESDSGDGDSDGGEGKDDAGGALPGA